MKLNADPLNLSQNDPGPLFCEIPVFSCYIAFSHRTYQESGVRIEKLVIEKASSGMIRLAAENGSPDLHPQAVGNLSGINGILISIGGLILSEDSTFRHLIL